MTRILDWDDGWELWGYNLEELRSMRNFAEEHGWKVKPRPTPCCDNGDKVEEKIEQIGAKWWGNQVPGLINSQGPYACTKDLRELVQLVLDGQK